VQCGRDGTIWAGTVSSGVSRLSGRSFTNYSDADGLPSNSVNSIAEGFDGTIWVATPNGLASYSNAHWGNYTARDGLPSPSVRLVFEDPMHNLWIATSGGLSYLSSGKIRVPTDLPEVLREEIFGIAEDSMGFLWFTTSDHVVRVNRERLLAGSLLETDIQSFGAEDGLKGGEGVSRDNTLVADHAGRIWLSLSSGLSMADPNITLRNSGPVAVRIESVSAGGRQLDTQGPIKIPPGIQNITLNYRGTNLFTPERIRFRYKLDGSGQGWSDIVASSQVVFSNLGPGSYNFRILASSSIGLWNGPETNIPFVIEPAFWQTWWFRVTCFVLLLAALWTIYILRLRHVTTLLHLRHQERLSEREDIARDLHDTFFQSVQSLFLRLHTASRHLPEHSPVKETVEEVLNDSDRVMSEGREMFLDVPKKEFRERDFADLIAGYCAEFATAHPIEYRVQVDGSPRSLNPLVTAELGKIAREAIYNAFRHSKASAIEVEVTYGRREMRLRVRDNGQGFEPTLLQANSGHLHLGLQNMRKRAEKLDAEFGLWSRLGSGTELEVILAAQRAYSTTNKTWVFPGMQRRG
jgi:two-component sensor histidine kinase